MQDSLMDADVSRKVAVTGRHNRALDRLVAFVTERRSRPIPVDFLQFEKDLHARVTEVERELLAEELARADVTAEAIQVGDTVYRRVLQSEETYETAAGPVRVLRTLYKDRGEEEAHAICPLDLRLGIVEGRWTPLAARTACWVVGQMTPGLAEELFARVGNMTPSKSSLDRLPKQVSARWEDERKEFEALLRVEELVPTGTATVAVSLDGVLAPMKDGGRAEKRAETAAAGKQTKGPAGYREVGCGTISFYDADGEFLNAIRMARMPESKKATLKRMLEQELAAALKQCPNVALVTLADGSKDNWEFLQKTLPSSVEILDIWHAAEHLNDAMGAAHGDGSVEARAQFDYFRRILKEAPDGVERVIGALVYQRKKHPRSDRIAGALGFFRRNRRRMRYASYAAENLPIGSGVVEAACRTLVSQRLKQSGMRWGMDGGQAVLTMRSWHQSNRFDRAWALLAATYKTEVQTYANVIPLHGISR